jgi:hypothetical protein
VKGVFNLGELRSKVNPVFGKAISQWKVPIFAHLFDNTIPSDLGQVVGNLYKTPPLKRAGGYSYLCDQGTFKPAQTSATSTRLVVPGVQVTTDVRNTVHYGDEIDLVDLMNVLASDWIYVLDSLAIRAVSASSSAIEWKHLPFQELFSNMSVASPRFFLMGRDVYSELVPSGSGGDMYGVRFLCPDSSVDLTRLFCVPGRRDLGGVIHTGPPCVEMWQHQRGVLSSRVSAHIGVYVKNGVSLATGPVG